jgi:hypothetical protein
MVEMNLLQRVKLLSCRREQLCEVFDEMDINGTASSRPIEPGLYCAGTQEGHHFGETVRESDRRYQHESGTNTPQPMKKLLKRVSRENPFRFFIMADAEGIVGGCPAWMRFYTGRYNENRPYPLMKSHMKFTLQMLEAKAFAELAKPENAYIRLHALHENFYLDTFTFGKLSKPFF